MHVEFVKSVQVERFMIKLSANNYLSINTNKWVLCLTSTMPNISLWKQLTWRNKTNWKIYVETSRQRAYLPKVGTKSKAISLLGQVFYLNINIIRPGICTISAILILKYIINDENNCIIYYLLCT